MKIEEQIQLVRASGVFDARWYMSRYRDVAVLGMEPTEHFLRYGALMRRSTSEEFDTRFYLDTYADVAHSGLNPLVHYLLHGRTDNRPTSRAQLSAQMADLQARVAAEWENSVQPGSRMVSYCIPVMGRLDDLKGTLRINLDAHVSMRSQVEFLIVLFGDWREAMDWLREGFADELADGFLRVVTDETLDSWHFGKAKNAFRAHLAGDIYSSLDGDNFVTLQETHALLAVNRQYEGFFLAHHFSGQWGDGTSGRISLPATIYRAVGYEPLMLPRQYDEIDLILNALSRFPALPFLCVDSKSNLFTKSNFARTFFKQEGLPNRIRQFDGGDRRVPLNPRGEDYTGQTPHLRDTGNFNACLSGFLRSKNPDQKNNYLDKLSVERHRLIESLPREMLADTLFTLDGRPELPQLGTEDIALFVCVRNEEHFLPDLIRHYRARGVTAFFIVDDGSDLPLENLLHAPDVHVFHPKVGTFRTAKTLWIEALVKLYLPEGNWFLTVDADEFIHLPPNFESFSALARHLEAAGADHAAGLMLDLLPAPGTKAAALAEAQTAFAELFTWCCNMLTPAALEYTNHRSIAWGFGPHAALSWRVDTRYHAFGTFDSLRKVPFLRHRPCRHLNQGFHTLHHTDGKPALGHDIWALQPLLPVYHYKLVRLFSDDARDRMLRQAESYHHRTGGNIQRIFAADNIHRTQALLRLEGQMAPVEQIVAWLSSHRSQDHTSRQTSAPVTDDVKLARIGV